MYTVEEGIEQRGIYHLTQLIGLARLQCQKPLYQLCRASFCLPFWCALTNDERLALKPSPYMSASRGSR